MANRSQSTDARSRAARRGFTLLESMLAAAVLSVAVVGLCLAMGAAHQSAAAGEHSAAAAMLGRQLLEQFSARPFDQLGTVDGYTDTTHSLAMADGTSIAMGGLLYTRHASVEHRAAPAGPASAGGDFAVVTVRVIAPDGTTTTLRKMFSNVEMRR